MKMSNKEKNAGAYNGAGKTSGHTNGVPQARVRLGRVPEASLRQPFSPAQPDGNEHSSERARMQAVRPVTARIGNAHGNGNSNGNGNGHGVTARISSDTRFISAPGTTTSRLRDTDLKGLRLRLKTEEWDYTKKPPTRRASAHRRPLPYFMMRQRNMRARSKVGHTRAQVAAMRFGSGGPTSIIVRLAMLALLLSGLVLAAGAGGSFAGAAYYVSNLPPVDPYNLQSHGISIQTSKIYDRNGTPLYDLVDEQTGRREELTIDQISPLVISATVAAEDSSFYTNFGIEPLAIARAVSINLSGDGQSGASTITQQLVRQIVLTQDERSQRSFTRKIKEAVLAVQMTREYSKNEIMDMFLNQNYYGHRAYGIGAASLSYFGKPAKDLTLPEAALLAGLPQAPTEYDPLVNPEQAKRRQAIVLDLMAKQRMITQEQADDAKAANLTLHPYTEVLRAPHFVYYVKQYLETKYGPNVGDMGLKIYTTLDLGVQDAAEKVARDRVDQLKQQQATNAAIVIMRPNTGEILGMVGSVDYNNTAIDGQVNVATRERQPGSSFKPITYVTAFEKGWTPGTVLLDNLTAFPNPGQAPYIPKDYDGKERGWVTVREALANSLNIPAVKALQFAGVQDVIDTAHKMGIKGLNRGTDWYGLALTLGGGEVTLLDMTNAYSTLANRGAEVDANPILKIEDSQGRVIECNSAYVDPSGGCSLTQVSPMAQNKQVIDPRYVYMISSILSDNKARSMEFGSNSPLKVSFPAAVKTGTTDDNRDSWTLGYTPDLTVGVWVGNSNNAKMLAVTGALGAAVIWNNMMQTFYGKPQFVDLIRDPNGKLQSDFVQPAGLITASACSAMGNVNDLFLKDAPPKGCTTYKDKNQQVRGSSGSSNNSNGNNSNGNNSRPAPVRPAAKPTPIPGIVFPPSNNP